MFNKKEKDMEKTILVIRRCQFGNQPARYNVEKSALTLEKATEFMVALNTLNTDNEITFILYNELGQMEYDRKEVA